jgi:hypothetical protein
MGVTAPTRAVTSESGTNPVRWFYLDGWCSPCPAGDVPAADWPEWEARYDNDCERGKRTTRVLWGWNRDILGHLHAPEMLTLCREAFGFAATPAPTLHGGGLHVMSPGAWLSTHLDYDAHPHILGKRRAINLIAFCHQEWRREWGGMFYLADPLGNPVVEIEPRPGRLVAFETNDLSYHGVTPVTGPAERVSVAAYLLADATPANTRRRALFLPNRANRADRGRG